MFNNSKTMKMSAPTLLDIGRFNSALHRFSLSDSWRIPSLKSDDVIWNLVLAYLNSFPLSNENELTEIIKSLTGDQKVNDNIKNVIEVCNPFLHHSECFYYKELSELVSRFKDRVEDYLEKNETPFPAEPKIFRYLEASSKLLSCHIKLITFPVQDKLLVIVFPVQTLQNRQTIDSKHISILRELTSSNGNEQEEFSFCIPKEIAKQKQRKALVEILKRTIPPIDEWMIQKVSDLPDITENFLISLLKNDFGQIISIICKSPYVLLKLADAGFQTDPRTKDSEGKSAFFHAFKNHILCETSHLESAHEKSQLVSLLYDHAANACLLTDASVRSPDRVIVENLLCLKDYLKLMEKDLEFAEVSEKSRKLFRDLSRFNDFQIEICKRINEIMLKINSNRLEEVQQRKEAILIILKTYESFYYADEDSALNVFCCGSRFEEFINHTYYFDKLDVSSTMMFFDNLFFLKEGLVLPNNVYLEIESSFFLFIFCGKYLEQCIKHKRFSRLKAFLERLSLQSQMCSFKVVLKETELSKDNIVNKIPETAVRTLTNLPEIYGQFLLDRLQHYLNAATRIIVKDLKSILVIERCLQVLGECCKQSDFNSVQKILTFALPKDFIKYLKRIRDHFCHMESDEIRNRNNLHQDLELFKGIQNDLIKLKELLLPIFSVQKYEMNRFLSSHSAKSVKRRILEEHENRLEITLSSPEIEENQLSMPTSNCQHPRKPNFEDEHISLMKEMNDLNCNENILDENTASCYKRIIQNMFSAVEEVLNNPKIAILEKVVELDHQFWGLETILSSITEDQKLSKYSEMLKPMLKDRESFFTKLKKNAYQFKQINKSTDQENSNSFMKYGTLCNIKDIPSISMLSNENEDNDTCPKKVESSETNQVENQINRRNFETSVLEKFDKDCIIQQTIDTKEIKKAVDFPEKAEDPETIDLTEENDLPSTEASSMTSCDGSLPDVSQDHSVNVESDDPADLMDDNIFDAVLGFLNNYKKLADSLSQEFPDNSNENFQLKNVEKYYLALTKHKYLDEQQKQFILGCVPEQLKNVSRLKKEAMDLLAVVKEYTPDLRNTLLKLNLTDSKIKKIKENIEKQLNYECYPIIEKISDYYLDLEENMELGEINRRKYELLCEKLKITDDAKDILSSIVSGQSKKVPGNQFEFLENRIKMLKNILIDEYNSIKQLWKEVDTPRSTPRSRMHVKEKIVQLYLNDSEIQAYVEMLLLDCMNTLNSEGLQNLWRKGENLLSGVSLRNVLAHGHPLLETLGRLLDPKDLPSELVEMILKLISEEYVIHCIKLVVERSKRNGKSPRDTLKERSFDNVRDKIQASNLDYVDLMVDLMSM